MSAAAPEVSVVIPVRDGEASLPPLLASLEAQTLARDRFEVIVVDNASRDATVRVATEHGARVVHEPIANRSRARNAGIAAARGELVAFTDADCVATPGWLDAFLGCRDKAPLLAGPVETTTSAQPNAIERLERAWRFAQEHWVAQGWAATASMAVRREALDAIGGFDPAYAHIGEDADVCVRAARAGYALAYCPGAAVTHEAERELEPMLRRSFRHGYGAHQARARIGVGRRAITQPWPVLSGRAALRSHGVAPERLPAPERRRLGVLAQASYAARIAGSAWAQVKRAR